MNATTDSMTLIQPAPVQRDETGCWWHPALPNFDENAAAYRAWLDAQGLETARRMLEDEPDHPLYDAYFEGGEHDISSWTSAPPRGDGWFTLYVGDTEDGPEWVWVRHIGSRA